MGYIGQAPANKVVTSADIEDGVVSAADLAANSVDSSELVDGSIDLSHLSASGTKSSSTYFRGDNSFATVSAGTALTGSTNNTIPTVTGANAITGEANLTYNAALDPPALKLQNSRLELNHDGDGTLYLTIDSNRGAAGDHIGELLFHWDGTAVAKVVAKAGADTTNKDDADLAFFTTPSGGSITEQMKITSDGRGLSQFTAKAWVSFDGTGTVAINDSHNVSSLTDNGTGDYTVNFSNSLANGNYSISVSGRENDGTGGHFCQAPHVDSPATGSFRMGQFNNTFALRDSYHAMAIVFGD